MEHALRALFERLLGEQTPEENQVNTHLGVILAHPELDLHALFERISSIAVAPGGESEPSRPASASRRKS